MLLPTDPRMTRSFYNMRALQPLGVATACEATAEMVATNRGVSLHERQQQGEELEPAVMAVPATMAEINPQVLRARGQCIKHKVVWVHAEST